MRRPLIGVTTSEIRRRLAVEQVRHGEPPQVEMTLGMKYLRAIELAGGLPVVLPPLEQNAIRPLLERLDGLLLSGGPDLDPASYGGEEHPDLGPIEPHLDVFEVALARRADRCAMPVLGVCRGAQALNVARRGTLHPHVPELSDGSVEHRQTQPSDEVTHAVDVAAGSLLSTIVGNGQLQVNSFHHQAVDRLGRGLRAVAWAPDGIVEAVEDPARELLLGVQWHAETLVADSSQLALFERLVRAASAHTLLRAA